jgi:GcrA cell cycle regulator
MGEFDPKYQPKGMARDWTAEETAAIEAWAREEITMAQALARCPELTKSMIIGRAHRLKLREGRPSVIPKKAEPPPALPKASQTCQFPHGDPGEPGFHFCGAPVARVGGSYCAACERRCYVVPPQPVARPHRRRHG